MRDTDPIPALPTFEGPRCHIRTDGEARLVAATIARWLDGEDLGADTHRIMVARAADPLSASVADTLAHVATNLGSDCRMLATPLAPVLSHAIIAGACDAGILVEGTDEGGRSCQLTVFGTDGRPLDHTAVRRLCACAGKVKAPDAARADQVALSSHNGISYLRSLSDAFHALGHSQEVPTVSVTCVAPEVFHDYVEAALSCMATTVEVVAAAEHADLDASLTQAMSLALERGSDIALAFGRGLDSVRCAALGDAQATRLGDDESLELALKWLLAATETTEHPIILVSDIGSTRAIDALAERFGATLVRTLPGSDAVALEVAYQRRSSAPDSIILGLTADAAMLVADATGVPCPIALAMALTGAAADAKARGRTLMDELRAIDDELGCHRAAHVTIAFETIDHAPLLMMRLRKDERELLCGMVVTSTTDFLSGRPVPGDPTRTLPFFDAIAWTLSDGSTLVLYAEEASSRAHALILVRADTLAEAQAVSSFLTQEAHVILTS